MGRKRACFAASVCCSDGFLDLPASAQALYLQLGFAADSDGAIDGIRSLLRLTGCTDADLSALVESGFLVEAGGVLFVAAWWVNNTRNARDYRPGDHQGALSLLTLGDDKFYRPSNGKPLDYPCTSEVNRIEQKAIQGESKGTESNPTQPNPTQSNPKEEKDAPAPARAERRNAPCPVCGSEFAITKGIDGWHGWCPHHGDFECS